MTNSNVVSVGVYYVQSIKQIGLQIENEQAEYSANTAPEEFQVSVDKNKRLTFNSLREVLCKVTESSKELYYQLIKQNRSNRRKLLSNLEEYAALIENLENEIALSIGDIANEVFEKFGLNSERIDLSIVYHFQKVDRQTKILKDLVESRMKHRMENGDSARVEAKELEKVFKFLKNFTAEIQNFKVFSELSRPAWNIHALFETYLFDKIWEEFEIEEEDILCAISKVDLDPEIISLIEDYQANLVKVAAAYKEVPSSKFLSEKLQEVRGSKED